MIPAELKYTKKHEWVKIDGKTAVIGITDYAQSALGDITFIEPPKLQKTVKQFEELAVVESVKAASDIFSPVSGTVCEVNSELETSPDLVNKDPYGQGWICKLDNVTASDVNNLLSADEYDKFVKEQENH